MRKIVAIVALIFATSCAHGASTTQCDLPDPSIRFYGPSLSVTELEQIGREFAAKNPAAPQVPFAYGHKNWQWLKAQYQAGDRIQAFEGPQGHDGNPFAWGYALLRGKCLVGLLTLRRT